MSARLFPRDTVQSRLPDPLGVQELNCYRKQIAAALVSAGAGTAAPGVA